MAGPKRLPRSITIYMTSLSCGAIVSTCPEGPAAGANKDFTVPFLSPASHCHSTSIQTKDSNTKQSNQTTPFKKNNNYPSFVPRVCPLQPFAICYTSSSTTHPPTNKNAQQTSKLRFDFKPKPKPKSTNHSPTQSLHLIHYPSKMGSSTSKPTRKPNKLQKRRPASKKTAKPQISRPIPQHPIHPNVYTRKPQSKPQPSYRSVEFPPNGFQRKVYSRAGLPGVIFRGGERWEVVYLLSFFSVVMSL